MRSILLFAGLAACRPPSGPDAPGGRFDAGRAIRDAGAIAALGPRPTGSSAGARARALLAERLEQIGIAAEVEAWQEKDARRGVAGHGRNVVALVRGKRRTAILVSARADGPAGDPDTMGALGPATLLELARAVRAGERLEHDLVLLATEGAEADLGERGFARTSVHRRAVRVQVRLDPRGARGAPGVLWASAGAASVVQAYARSADRPGGGSHLPTLLGAPVVAMARWPTVVLGTLPGPASGPGPIARGLGRDLGQSLLDLVRELDRAPAAPASSPPVYFELPFHLLLATDGWTSGLLAWLLVASALVVLVRARRVAGPVLAAVPWLAVAFAGAAGLMAAAGELVGAARGSEGVTAARVMTMCLAGILWLLVWQRIGALGGVRRLAIGLSQTVPLVALWVMVLTAGTIAAVIAASPSAHLFWGPLAFALFGLLRSAGVPDRRRRLAGAAVCVAGAIFFWLAPLRDAWAVLEDRGTAASWPLAGTLACLGLFVVPPLAALAAASVLKPGAGQITMVALVAACVGVYGATEPLATAKRPRRMVVDGVTHAARGRSFFLVRGDAKVAGRSVHSPWFARALGRPGAQGTAERALAAPDGLSIPPMVRARLERGRGGQAILDAHVVPLRHADALHIVLSPQIRLLAASLPTVRWSRGEPWIARVLNPPPEGVRYRARLVLPAGLGLGDMLAIDEGDEHFAPLAPSPDRSLPTVRVLRAFGVTPLDTRVASPPPPPSMPPDIAPPEPAGPEPWWTIMARERYRRR